MRPQMNVSDIWQHRIISQGVVNGRLVTEFRADPDPISGHLGGTLVCEHARPDAGYDLTVTRFGLRFYDLGVVTWRED